MRTPIRDPDPGAPAQPASPVTHALGSYGRLDRCWDFTDGGALRWVPVPASSSGGRVLLGRRYADALFMLRHRDLRAIPRDLAFGGVSDQDDDGYLRRHASYARDVVNPLWNPRAAPEYRDGIRQVARDCANDIRGAGRVDLASGFAAPFTDGLTTFLCGLRDGEASALRDLSGRTTGTLLYQAADHETTHAAWGELYEYSRPLIRRARKGGESLMARTIRRTDEAMPADETERTIPTGFNGFGTVYPTILKILIWLARDPELLHTIRRQPERAPAAVHDIMIQFAYFTFGLPGLLTRPMRGVRAGMPVFPDIHAAHTDPARPPGASLAWGSGTHACLSQWPGRIALTEAVLAIAGLPVFEPAGDDWLPASWSEGTMPVPPYALART